MHRRGEQLAGLLQTLIRETDLQVILVLSKTDDIPEFITHVIPVEHLDILPKVPRTEYVGQRPRIPVRVLEEDKAARILALPEKENRLTTTDTEGCMLRFNHVSIRYGQRTILKDLDWTVKQNEKWALGGENGAGNPPSSVWYVPTIRKATPATSNCSDGNEVREKAFGTSNGISAMSARRCTAHT